MSTGLGAAEKQGAEFLKRDRIVLIEDTLTYQHLICTRMVEEFGFKPLICRNYQELEKLLEASGDQLHLAVSDLHTSGAERGAALRLLNSHNIPTILMSGHQNPIIGSDLGSVQIGDHIVKNSPSCVDQLIDVIRHYEEINATRVLIVDGPTNVADQIAPALQSRLLSISVVASKEAALTLLRKDNHFNLIMCEFGASDDPETSEQFIQAARLILKSRTMRILGVLTDEDYARSSQHLKTGIDDFIRFPARPEELHWRVGQNIVQMKSLRELQEHASRDYLTGLYNRRHFFKEGNIRIAAAALDNRKQAVAMIDIDHFKKLNDTYGHDIGDLVLKGVAERFEKICGDKHLLARMGGEEFIILIDHHDMAKAEAFCERVRKSISTKPFETEDGDLNVTVSIGVANALGDEDFINYITAADQYLYMAKSLGRNKVLTEPEFD